MNDRHATSADFAAWEARAETMTEDALRYTVKDCREAELAMRGHNPIREAFYSDQACTYFMVMKRRFPNHAPLTI